MGLRRREYIPTQLTVSDQQAAAGDEHGARQVQMFLTHGHRVERAFIFWLTGEHGVLHEVGCTVSTIVSVLSCIPHSLGPNVQQLATITAARTPSSPRCTSSLPQVTALTAVLFC